MSLIWINQQQSWLPASKLHRSNLILALLCAAQFMLILDLAIVNVALPSMQRTLGLSVENIQWVVGGYALTFGGFLMLGGLLADGVGGGGGSGYLKAGPINYAAG